MFKEGEIRWFHCNFGGFCVFKLTYSLDKELSIGNLYDSYLCSIKTLNSITCSSNCRTISIALVKRSHLVFHDPFSPLNGEISIYVKGSKKYGYKKW